MLQYVTEFKLYRYTYGRPKILKILGRDINDQINGLTLKGLLCHQIFFMFCRIRMKEYNYFKFSFNF